MQNILPICVENLSYVLVSLITHSFICIPDKLQLSIGLKPVKSIHT